MGRCGLWLGLTSFLVSVSHPQHPERFLVHFWWVDPFGIAHVVSSFLENKLMLYFLFKNTSAEAKFQNQSQNLRTISFSFSILVNE